MGRAWALIPPDSTSRTVPCTLLAMSQKCDRPAFRRLLQTIVKIAEERVEEIRKRELEDLSKPKSEPESSPPVPETPVPPPSPSPKEIAGMPVSSRWVN